MALRLLKDADKPQKPIEEPNIEFHAPKSLGFEVDQATTKGDGSTDTSLDDTDDDDASAKLLSVDKAIESNADSFASHILKHKKSLLANSDKVNSWGASLHKMAAHLQSSSKKHVGSIIKRMEIDWSHEMPSGHNLTPEELEQRGQQATTTAKTSTTTSSLAPTTTTTVAPSPAPDTWKPPSIGIDFVPPASSHRRRRVAARGFMVEEAPQQESSASKGPPSYIPKDISSYVPKEASSYVPQASSPVVRKERYAPLKRARTVEASGFDASPMTQEQEQPVVATEPPATSPPLEPQMPQETEVDDRPRPSAAQYVQQTLLKESESKQEPETTAPLVEQRQVAESHKLHRFQKRMMPEEEQPKVFPQQKHQFQKRQMPEEEEPEEVPESRKVHQFQKRQMPEEEAPQKVHQFQKRMMSEDETEITEMPVAITVPTEAAKEEAEPLVEETAAPVEEDVAPETTLPMEEAETVIPMKREVYPAMQVPVIGKDATVITRAPQRGRGHYSSLYQKMQQKEEEAGESSTAPFESLFPFDEPRGKAAAPRPPNLKWRRPHHQEKKLHSFHEQAVALQHAKLSKEERIRLHQEERKRLMKRIRELGSHK